MLIHHALYENKVTRDPNDYAAIAKPIDSVNLDRMIDRMIDRGSTTSRADLLALLEDAIGAAESLLLGGMRVNFGGVVELFPRVRGIFNGPADRSDASRHIVDVGTNPGARVREPVRAQATLINDAAVKPAPDLLVFRELGSDTLHHQVTPGNIGELTGRRLKFDAAQADEGIFFVPTTVGTSTRVTVLQRNKPSSLVFLIPATLASGDYRIDVRPRIAQGTRNRLDVGYGLRWQSESSALCTPATLRRRLLWKIRFQSIHSSCLACLCAMTARTRSRSLCRNRGAASY